MFRFFEIFLEFFKLGFISFGGPSAHIAYFRERFVEVKSWISEAEYASILALTQFLPGPGSSQMGMAIGWKRGGVPGSIAAFLGFTAPSAVIMVLFAMGVMQFGVLDEGEAGWIRGLQIAVVVVIANAVSGMADKLCRGRELALIGIIATGVVLGVDSAWTQVGVIVGGAVGGWLIFFGKKGEVDEKVENGDLTRPGSTGFAVSCLVVFFLILLATPWAANLGNSLVSGFAGMYKSGALVFGGGHVVLPLLSEETVKPEWLGDAEFSAGYGAAQAVPGPLFTIASYLGALLQNPGGPWLGALVCTLGIFLPGWLLTMGTLPFWEKLKHITALKNALAGANAAVVGLLAAALYDPVWVKAIRGPGEGGTLDVIFLLGVAALLLVLKLPAWLVVIVAGVAGAGVL